MVAPGAQSGSLAQFNVQFAQLSGTYFTRCISQQTGGTLGFREGDHFTNRSGAGHQHHQTIKTKRQATMRRSTVLECIQQEAEFFVRFLIGDAQHLEYGFLYGLIMDTDGTATQFGAVQYHVIGTGQLAFRLGDQFFRAAARRGERVVQRGQGTIAVLFEHREVDHPQRRPFALDQIHVFADLDAQRTQGFVNDGRLIGAKEHDVAVFGFQTLHHLHGDIFAQELDDRGLQAFGTLLQLIDLDPGQALGTVDTDKAGVLVDDLAGQLGTTRDFQCRYATFRVLGGTGKYLEFDILQQVGNVHQLQRNTQIRLVGAVAVHRFRVWHAREVAQVYVQQFDKQLADHAFGQAHDPFLVHERGFDIDLGEFRLTVGTQVFITEALGDLIVAVETGHHQQLLEQLGRLRQGKKAAFVSTAWHQIVTRTFRGCAGQDRCLDIEKAVVFQIVADVMRDFGTEPQLALNFRTTQVDIAVTQAHILTHLLVFVQLERRGFGLVQNDQFLAQHLDLAGAHLLVDGAFRTPTYGTAHFNHVFVADAVSQIEAFLTVRVEHHLSDAFTVAKVEKNHSAMVTATVYPAAECDIFTDMF